MDGFIRQLGGRHDVTLLSFCDKNELILANDLTSLRLEVIPVPRGIGAKPGVGWLMYLMIMKVVQFLRSILLWQPMYVSGFWHPRMARLIRSLTTTRQYDIVQFEMTSMAQYRTSVARGKTILHEHDVAVRPAYREFKSATSPAARISRFINWCRWASYERRMLRRFDHVFCVTSQDSMLIRSLFHCRNAVYLPRGVDIPETIPAYKERDPATLLFVGTFAHPPNVDAVLWLVNEIFPIVLKRYPDARLRIIGKHPPGELRDHALKQPQVEIHGFVDDIESFLLRASLFVAPLRFGGGVKVKILHAMAHGLPVVTTRIGKEGIDGLTPDHLAIAGTTDEIAGEIMLLLGDPSRAERMGMNGRELMRTTYSWKLVIDVAEQVYLS